jgi:two-component system CheB/CheR fusion protein
MNILDGKLKLVLKPVKKESYLPINDFFNSLADQYREKSIGILLSGNAPDGALG